MHTGSSPRSYRAKYIPDGVLAEEVEFRADQGLLPTVQIQAPDAAKAMADACAVTGRPIFSVERVETVA